ncbi:MAG: peptidoglycan-binding protein [Propionibacteriaceae bacterium]|nr:peptidoglycan-binding protein [Propionibacteriaceae bacterium]
MGLWFGTLIVAIIVPVVALVIVAVVAPSVYKPVDAVPTPITLPVSTTTDNNPLAVKASLTWTPGPQMVAPAWSGLVTQIDIHLGDTVSSGAVVAHIDGLTRVALASATPFYRPLGTGAQGADVAMLRDALAGLGISPTGSGSTFDATLGRAVSTFQTKILGLSAASADGVFDPSLVVYLPVSSLVVDTIDMTVGTPAPAQGQEIVTSSPTLQPFTLSASSRSLPASSDGYVLLLSNGQQVPLEAGFTLSDPTNLAAVASTLPDRPTSFTGQTQLTTPQTYSMVPASSIVTGANGKFCVFTLDSSGKFTPITVQPGGGLPGQTEVTLPDSVTSVVSNPGPLHLTECPGS